ncbi:MULTISPECIES: right-handed parallel beta-helix repeat-containing protein [unclassified Sphingobacterium]|uniref:right-handed parallel beta-helix repeat-containing protein n=1 Tax=unclassified Sphingobacterium TaxID=2609468 RepID=UPI00143ACB72|nr:right-handed parallel beta-helix repeat-containing protein [Sphingobacterium sp. B16(2022)]NJI74228.1 right-handed parallel beta-helix repeat-containing protein [Sphingobacterium sp. B16(2022)]
MNKILGQAILFLMVFFVTVGHGALAQTIQANEHGLQPNTFVDVSAAMQQVLKQCKDKKAKKLVLQPGRYDFWPEKAAQRKLYITNSSSETEWPDKTKHIGMLIEDMHDLVVEGNGAEFVFYGKMTTFSIIRSQNIRLQDLTITFERPTMSEMTIKEVGAGYLVAQVNPTSTYTLKNNKLFWYGEGWTPGDHLHTMMVDTAQGISLYSKYEPLAKARVKEIAPNILRFEGELKADYKVGGILSMRNTVRDEVGGFIYRSKNIKLFNLTMNYMHGIGITSQFSENLDYEQVKVVPVKGRSIAAFADGMQFSGCKGKIKVSNCHFKGLHDDPINVHGTYLQIAEIVSPKELIVEFKHHQSYGFDAFTLHDTISIVSREAIQPLGQLTVTGIETLSLTKIRLKLNGSIPTNTKIGDAVENLTWTPEVDIRNSRFERTNARGILVTTPRKVHIEGNIFYRTGMHGILIAGDVNSWFESGAVSDVTIKNNSFVECGYNLPGFNYAIAILPENKVQLKGHYVHRNINILDNDFKVFSPYVLRAKSVDGLQFERNRIAVSTSNFPLAVDSNQTIPAIVLDNCQHVVIKNNTATAGDDLSLGIHNMSKSDVKTDLKIR